MIGSVVRWWLRRHAEQIIELGAPILRHVASLDALDIPSGVVGFEHLAGLFSSNAMSHGLISQPIGQAAYTFRLIRERGYLRGVEIGRYLGGGTLLLAAAVGSTGVIYSIDNHEKTARLGQEDNDPRLAAKLRQLGLRAVLISGDSSSYRLPNGNPVDFVFIDGDHSLEGVTRDLEAWAPRVAPDGALLMDDAGTMEVHQAIGRFLVRFPEWHIVRRVDRLAHLERYGA